MSISMAHPAQTLDESKSQNITDVPMKEKDTCFIQIRWHEGE